MQAGAAGALGVARMNRWHGRWRRAPAPSSAASPRLLLAVCEKLACQRAERERRGRDGMWGQQQETRGSATPCSRRQQGRRRSRPASAAQRSAPVTNSLSGSRASQTGVSAPCAALRGPRKELMLVAHQPVERRRGERRGRSQRSGRSAQRAWTAARRRRRKRAARAGGQLTWADSVDHHSPLLQLRRQHLWAAGSGRQQVCAEARGEQPTLPTV